MQENITALVEKAKERMAAGDAAGCSELLEGLEDPPGPMTRAQARQLAMARDMQGRALAAQGKSGAAAAMQSGVESFKRFLEHGDEISAQDMLFLANLLQNLCFALLEQKEPLRALDAGREALELARKYGDPASPVLAGIMFRISAVHYRSHNLDEAEALTRKAMDIWNSRGDMKMVGECLNNLGRIYEERGEAAEGIALHRKAVKLRRSLPNRTDLAFSLGNLGVALACNGEWEQAANNLEEAVGIYAASGMTNSADCRGFAANLEICRKALAD